MSKKNNVEKAAFCRLQQTDFLKNEAKTQLSKDSGESRHEYSKMKVLIKTHHKKQTIIRSKPNNTDQT